MAWGDGGPEIRRQFFTECISAAVACPSRGREGERADVPEHADPILIVEILPYLQMSTNKPSAVR